ncbi:MAG TPA: hypothetical protein VEZ90_17005, partial [Blastocatellia bacterium]|nr:hypothetical protein [Blastocatellia bacterium]
MRLVRTSLAAAVGLAIILQIGALATAAHAPSRQQVETTAKTPQADRHDVDTMDHIMAAVYDVISGPAGQKRNWDRMRSLFVPGARLIP